MSAILIGLIAAAAITAQADFIFDRVQPIIHLKTDSKVVLGVAEYDMNFAYTKPCMLSEGNIKNALASGETLNQERINALKSFIANCDVLEWLKEIEQLMALKLPKVNLDFMKKKIPSPYDEPE